jgi:hypothetical protein
MSMFLDLNLQNLDFYRFLVKKKKKRTIWAILGLKKKQEALELNNSNSPFILLQLWTNFQMHLMCFLT